MNPIKDLIEAYMKGRRIQLEEMKKQTREREKQTKELRRIADALEKFQKRYAPDAVQKH